MRKARGAGLPIAQPEIPTLATLEDATLSLERIAVAEAAERHWARAKDAKKLLKAIEVKISDQVAYVVWRQDVAAPGGDRKSRFQNSNIDPLPAADPGAVQVHRWRERLCRIEAKRWMPDKAKIQVALEDAQHRCVRICEMENAGTIRGTEGTGEFERYTPSEYVEAAREVLGTIDLDPASSELAQQTVAAKKFFSEEDNGLEQEWCGRVFLNPPYHRELAPRFINKLLEEIAANRTTEAILLTNNSTDTAWFQTAADSCQCICFPAGRIHFTVPERDPVLPTQGQAFFYFGERHRQFVKVFTDKRAIGFCVRSYG